MATMISLRSENSNGEGNVITYLWNIGGVAIAEESWRVLAVGIVVRLSFLEAAEQICP